MSAIFSPCGTWRYRLDYDFLRQDRPTIAFGLHNPSIANGEVMDPTWRRGIRYAMRWDAGKVVYVNPWAAVATKPKYLWAAPDPVGPDNDAHIAAVAREVAESGGFFVCAWGAVSPPWHKREAAKKRLEEFEALVRSICPDVRAMGVTKDGHPRHPLYLRSDAEPTPWKGNAMHGKHLVDAWDGHRLDLKRRYIAEGMSEEAADDKATAEVRREIRDSQPINLPR